MFKVEYIAGFKKEFNKLEKTEQQRLLKFFLQLETSDGNVGKELGPKYFKEKKFEGKRLYFLVFNEFLVILAVALSNKKDQQRTIDQIRLKLDEYYFFVSQNYRKN